MDIEKVKQDIGKVVSEIQDFAEYQPNGEYGAIEYLFKAREVISTYERMISSEDNEEKIYEEINLIHQYLKDYSDYLEFHRE